VSLTSRLAARGDPVRSFFEGMFPNTRAVASTAAPALRGGRQAAPLAAADGVNPGRAGAAVDFLLRFALASDPCPRGGAAVAGAGMLGRKLSLAALSATAEALAWVGAIAPYRRTVSDSEWEELTRASILFASFESVYRSGLPPLAFIERVASPPRAWQEWAALVCVEEEIEDVAVLGWAAVEDHAHLRGSALVCNPTFGLSRALGGADADLITGSGELLELKSTSTSRTCSGKDLWQLCGYALADTHNDRGIKSVGISALRWRTQIAWGVAELLCALAGRDVELEMMRRDFAAAAERRPPDSARRVRRQRVASAS
jgi:hypothetical protein